MDVISLDRWNHIFMRWPRASVVSVFSACFLGPSEVHMKYGEELSWIELRRRKNGPIRGFLC